MQEYAFDRDEAILAKDDAWRRLFSRVEPQVRRDILGWMFPPLKKLSAELFPDGVESSWDQRVEDYVNGASLVLDPLPDRAYEFYANDRHALDADARAVIGDARSVYDEIVLLNQWVHEVVERPEEDRERQQLPKPDTG